MLADTVPMPIVLSALGGTAAVVLALAVYCTCRCWRAKRFDHSADSTPILPHHPDDGALPGSITQQQQQQQQQHLSPASPFSAQNDMHRRLQRQQATNLAISQSTPDLLDENKVTCIEITFCLLLHGLLKYLSFHFGAQAGARACVCQGCAFSVFVCVGMQGRLCKHAYICIYVCVVAKMVCMHWRTFSASVGHRRLISIN